MRDSQKGQPKDDKRSFGTAPQTPCFTPGTLIATDRGEKPVQALAVGDKVVTRDNGLKEIRWIGSREFHGAELRRFPHLNPILIRAGAFGDGLPERDMRISPNHRVLVNSEMTALYFEDREVLVAAKHLINNRNVYQVTSLGAHYLHLLFDRHEVILADGSWTESFHPLDRVLRGIGNAQRQEIFELFPELKVTGEAAVSAPVRRILTKKETDDLFQRM